MFIGILAISAAVALSVVSAIFSINGIVTIFSGAVLGAGIMGGVLEFSKISATVWLYSFWKKANALLKSYFIVAIVILILISSLGIFGYLAKAYVGQGEASQQIEIKIERLNQYIQREEQTIEQANKQLSTLNESVDRYLELNVITKGLEAREEQSEERNKLNTIIREAENKIAEYEDTLFEYKQELNTLEVNVGPIKYIAALLYGENNAVDYYDDAARLLIILIVIVFDPFAVLLMVAGNIALDRKPKSNKGRPKGSQNKPKTSTPVENKPPEESIKKEENFEKKEESDTTPTNTVEREDIPKIHKNNSLKKRRKVISNGRPKS